MFIKISPFLGVWIEKGIELIVLGIGNGGAVRPRRRHVSINYEDRVVVAFLVYQCDKSLK